MEIFGYPLVQHLEVFGALFVVLSVGSCLVRFLDERRTLRNQAVGVGVALLNTLYLAWVAFIFRAGRDFPLMISVTFGVILIGLAVFPYMAARGKLENYDQAD